MSKNSEFEALSRIYPVSRETFSRLELFVARVLEWQKKTNLVAPSTVDDIWSRHIADSLQCLAIKPQAKKWLDLGSGGGFPGMVIASSMAEREGSEVHLVESNTKKAAFLRQTNRQIGARAVVHCERIEHFEGDEISPEVVTARALAPLHTLLDLASPWLLKGAVAMFHKGREYERELEDCYGLWHFDLVNHESKISADSVILEISNLQRAVT